VVQFSAGLGTLCLNLNLHLWFQSSLLLNLNPEVQLRFRCEPSAPEVWDLIWAKYGKRSQNFFPVKSPNLWFRCRFGKNCCLPHLKPEPRVWFKFTPGSVGSQTAPWTVNDKGKVRLTRCMQHLVGDWTPTQPPLSANGHPTPTTQ